MVLADDLERPADAALELRRILNEKPNAARVRVKWERNRSSIEIYDYRRISAELGVSSAF